MQRDDGWLVAIAVLGAVTVGDAWYDAVTEGGVTRWMVAALFPFLVVNLVRQNRANKRRREG